MAAPTPEKPFIPTLRQYFQRVQSRGGDKELRLTLAADRKVTALASRRSETAKAEWLAAPDLIEKELLPNG